jgi:hypothetical protein
MNAGPGVVARDPVLRVVGVAAAPGRRCDSPPTGPVRRVRRIARIRRNDLERATDGGFDDDVDRGCVASRFSHLTELQLSHLT